MIDFLIAVVQRIVRKDVENWKIFFRKLVFRKYYIYLLPALLLAKAEAEAPLEAHGLEPP